ncbi:MAG TPA: saccharopine dehydrogenase C-terminal domain-containing protein [Solirubrobacteraceae bacterium]|jgi:saccharopine dehydrogenase (NAD+, L-lysine-forming)|nr:saccharopine dehydrogenase C-terminal domain-containing protein [Solirubrobacteraceae bacterium]
MRVLVVGAGGVGAAFASIAQRRPAFERIVLADVSAVRAHDVVAKLGEAGRFSAERVDASDREALVKLIERLRPDAVLNACDPRFNEPIFDAAFRARTTYLDMAMTLSHPHPQRPHELPGVMLGDLQLARHEQWEQTGLLALVGIGVEPGLSDVFARYAADELFSRVEQVGVRDGADLVVEGYDFAPTFSIWTTIEECLNPPLIWERGRGFYTTPPFSEPEVFDFPEGIGRVECVNVEHEEVVLIPRWVQCERVTFKYGLGQEFIDVLRTLHKLGLDSTEPVSVRSAAGSATAGGGEAVGVQVSPRDVVAATLPDPATLGERMTGRTCAGTWITGIGTDGTPRSTYLYHIVDNEHTMREYGSQAVVWQTAVNPVVALELLDEGVWRGTGVLGPEAFPPEPFLERLAELGAPHGQVEMPLSGVA